MNNKERLINHTRVSVSCVFVANEMVSKYQHGFKIVYLLYLII